MTAILNINSQELEQRKGYWTAKEIAQQPDIWRQTADIVATNKTAIDKWLQGLLQLNNLNVILTGAGTSAYVGLSIAPYLSTAQVHSAGHCNHRFSVQS